MRGYFGKGTIEHFFDDNVIEANKNIDIDHTTYKLVDNSGNEDNVLSMFQFTGLSQAQIRTAKERGFTEEQIRRMGEEDSLDEQEEMENEWGIAATEEEPQREWIFELSKIFDSAPTINLGPHKEGVSLASNRTDTSVYINLSTKNNNKEGKKKKQQ